MADQILSPRVTAPNLESYVNKHVSIVGKVTQLRGDHATIEADGVVTVILNREAHLTHGNAAFFVAKVNPDLSLKALSSRDVGPGVDMALCSKVADVFQRHKDIFGGADAAAAN